VRHAAVMSVWWFLSAWGTKVQAESQYGRRPRWVMRDHGSPLPGKVLVMVVTGSIGASTGTTLSCRMRVALPAVVPAREF
jgi:hypothetical protein